MHYDALYQASLNACLILLAEGVRFDADIPFQSDAPADHQQGFAQFGGAHILSLVTEVATRALKAVRYPKFNVHRRLRPDALAGRIANRSALNEAILDEMANDLAPLLNLVAAHNPAEAVLSVIIICCQRSLRARPCIRPTVPDMPQSPEPVSRS